MKKIISFVLIIIAIMALTSCKETLPSQYTGEITLQTVTDENTTLQTTTDEDTTVQTVNYEEVTLETVIDDGIVYPVFRTPHGLIKVASAEEARGEFPFLPSYRLLYYEMRGTFSDLVEDSIFDEWLFNSDKFANNDAEPQKMLLLEFIQDFDIPREKIDKAIENVLEIVHSLMRDGIDIEFERYEIPNADVLYTFNSVLINDYYSRDLKKAIAAEKSLQEWLKNNQPYRTYSEFLADN